MFGAIFRWLTAITSIALLWGYANTTGLTETVNKATDLNIPQTWTIPYIEKVIDPTDVAKMSPRAAALEALTEVASNPNSNQKSIEAAVAAAKKAGVPSKTITATLNKSLAEAKAKAPKAPAPKTTAPSKGGKTVYVTALADAKKLTVKGRAPKTGYKRELFGSAWTDNNTAKWGKNGCDTRNDILKRDLTKVTFKDAKKCAVQTGVLADKYTGKTINFKRGTATSSAVQIDHLIPLSDAWQKGAQSWDTAKRTKFANDPINLMASDGPTNGAKGDKDAATWLPPNKSFRCEYIAKQVTVKKTYGLWVTKAEQDAMVKILAGCVK